MFVLTPDPGMLLAMDNGPLQQIFDIITTLRGKDGCPWDQEQTAENILSDLVEETYELQWAHENESPDAVLDEAGDVLFVYVFAVMLLNEKHSAITLQSLADHAYKKIKRRHPHVFGDDSAKTKEEGLAHWERMKATEKKESASDTDVFKDVPGNLPPLRRAEQIQKRAARVGFDWTDTRGILAKIREEIVEIEEALVEQSSERVTEEVGDLFFSVANLARFLHIDSERALNDANAKFVRRFCRMQELAEKDGHTVDALDITSLEQLWQRAKRS